MGNLKSYGLLLVGELEDKSYFQKYFQEIYLVNSNIRAFNFYSMYKPLVIFFYYDEKNFDTLDVIKRIRKDDQNTIIVIVSNKNSINSLIDMIPLNLSGYLEKPYQEDKVKKILHNIYHDLDLQHEHKVRLRGNYTFNLREEILYNSKEKEVKLTGNELKLMKLMSSNRKQYVSFEYIECTIWYSTSSEYEDCHARLKALIYGLRRKLVENTIVNSYGLGYKLVCI